MVEMDMAYKIDRMVCCSVGSVLTVLFIVMALSERLGGGKEAMYTIRWYIHRVGPTCSLLYTLASVDRFGVFGLYPTYTRLNYWFAWNAIALLFFFAVVVMYSYASPKYAKNNGGRVPLWIQAWYAPPVIIFITMNAGIIYAIVHDTIPSDLLLLWMVQIMAFQGLVLIIAIGIPLHRQGGVDVDALNALSNNVGFKNVQLAKLKRFVIGTIFFDGILSLVNAYFIVKQEGVTEVPPNPQEYLLGDSIGQPIVLYSGLMVTMWYFWTPVTLRLSALVATSKTLITLEISYSRISVDDGRWLAGTLAPFQALDELHLTHMTTIPPHELLLHEVVGQGLSSVVHRATWHGAEVAVKQFRRLKLDDTADNDDGGSTAEPSRLFGEDNDDHVSTAATASESGRHTEFSITRSTNTNAGGTATGGYTSQSHHPHSHSLSVSTPLAPLMKPTTSGSSVNRSPMPAHDDNKTGENASSRSAYATTALSSSSASSSTAAATATTATSTSTPTTTTISAGSKSSGVDHSPSSDSSPYTTPTIHERTLTLRPSRGGSTDVTEALLPKHGHGHQQHDSATAIIISPPTVSSLAALDRTASESAAFASSAASPFTLAFPRAPGYVPHAQQQYEIYVAGGGIPSTGSSQPTNSGGPMLSSSASTTPYNNQNQNPKDDYRYARRSKAVRGGEGGATDGGVGSGGGGGYHGHETGINFANEVIINQHMGHHPRVASFLGACLSRRNKFMVFNFMPFGSVERILIGEGKFSLQGVLQPYELLLHLRILTQMAVDAASGVMHVHSRRTVHRDIAARNFLVDSFHRVTVCDFGMSRILQEDQTAGVSEPEPLPVKYCAPETLKFQLFSEKTDVYMFGMFLYEVIARESPWRTVEPIVAADRILQGEHPEIPGFCPTDWAVLMRDCWQVNPADRPSMGSLYETLKAYLVRCTTQTEDNTAEIMRIYNPVSGGAVVGSGEVGRESLHIGSGATASLIAAAAVAGQTLSDSTYATVALLHTPPPGSSAASAPSSSSSAASSPLGIPLLRLHSMPAPDRQLSDPHHDYMLPPFLDKKPSSELAVGLPRGRSQM